MGPRDRFYPYLYHCDYIGLLGTVSNSKAVAREKIRW